MVEDFGDEKWRSAGCVGVGGVLLGEEGFFAWREGVGEAGNWWT